MKGVYLQKNSPYYWLRYYDQLEQDPNRKRKSVNTKIEITQADIQRKKLAKKKAKKVELIGTPELRKMVKEFRMGLNERNIHAKTGVKLIKKLTLSEGLEEYIFYRPKLKKKTIDAYRYAVKHMITACKDKQIHTYTKKDYTLLIRYSQEQGFSETTNAIIMRHLNPLWSYFVKNKYVAENIIVKLKTPKGIPRPINRKELRIILDYYLGKGIEKQLNTVLFLLYTGLRPSSAIVQDWEWVDFENEIMKAYNVKASRYFIFPIHDELKKLLIKIGIQSKGLILGYKSVDSLKFFEKDMHKLFEDRLFGRKYTLYNLRDTFASYLANKDVDVSNVQELLNHSDIKITKGHYVKIQTNYLKNKIDSIKFGEMISN